MTPQSTRIAYKQYIIFVCFCTVCNSPPPYTNILGVSVIHCLKERTQNKVKDELTVLRILLATIIV